MGMALSNDDSNTSGSVTVDGPHWTPKRFAQGKAVAEAERRIHEIITALEDDCGLVVDEIDVNQWQYGTLRRHIVVLWHQGESVRPYGDSDELD